MELIIRARRQRTKSRFDLIDQRQARFAVTISMNYDTSILAHLQTFLKPLSVTSGGRSIYTFSWNL